MKTITIRVSNEVFEEIEKKRGDKNKSDFYRKILTEYLMKTNEYGMNKTEYKRIQLNTIVNTAEYKALEVELKHKEELIKSKEERITDLQVQLGWIQMEHSKLSDRIPALPAPKKEKKNFLSFYFKRRKRAKDK